MSHNKLLIEFIKAARRFCDAYSGDRAAKLGNGAARQTLELFRVLLAEFDESRCDGSAAAIDSFQAAKAVACVYRQGDEIEKRGHLATATDHRLAVDRVGEALADQFQAWHGERFDRISFRQRCGLPALKG